MFSHTRQFVLIAVCSIIFVGPSTAQTTSDFDYTGDYVMQGKGYSANDSAYTGTCSFRRAEQGYQVSCYNQDTRHTYTGKGLARGDTLAVFIGDMLQGDHDAIYVGEYLILYQRKPDGSLIGTWVSTKSQFAGSETLTRKK